MLLLLAPTVRSEEVHVTARIVSDASTINRGSSFRLGVELAPEPGWHVYWRNPGEAGLATEVAFELPTGFDSDQLQWPVPMVFEQPGGLIGYGYKKPVVLAATVTSTAGGQTKLPVTVTASWLACKDVCVLGSAELTAELPLTGEALEQSRQALARWQDRLPGGAPPPATVTVTGGPVPETGKAKLVVWLGWSEPPGEVELFPSPGPGLKVDGVEVRTRGELTRVDLEVARLNHPSGRTSDLDVLVVIPNADGRRQATGLRIDLDEQ